GRPVRPRHALARRLPRNRLVITVATSAFLFPTPATTEICPLSLHDALPICTRRAPAGAQAPLLFDPPPPTADQRSCVGSPLFLRDRKSTRLNSSHVKISYAVFCLKKKKPERQQRRAGRQHQRRKDQ